MNWYEYEENAAKKGSTAVCGIDEAGRGPLAGPVCAAAVILPMHCEIDGLNDSKKLTEKKRESLFDTVTESALAYGIAYAHEAEIDEINILQATFLAMQRAYDEMAKKLKADYVLIDGNQMPAYFISIGGEPVVKGDAKSANIAAASILAKVSRDRLMVKLDEQYPAYGFAKHKGYPTKAHYEAIKAYGILDIHRKSFLRKLKDK